MKSKEKGKIDAGELVTIVIEKRDNSFTEVLSEMSEWIEDEFEGKLPTGKCFINCASSMEDSKPAAVRFIDGDITNDLLCACRNALADLEGIMPEFEPDGERQHPAWQTIKELKKIIKRVGKVD